MKFTLLLALHLMLRSFSSSTVLTLACSDREGTWEIGAETRNWCRWAGKKGNLLAASRCEEHDLYEKCPVTCGSCFTTAPSLAPSTAACSCETLSDDITIIKDEFHNTNDKVKSMGQQIHNMDDKINIMSQQIHQMDDKINKILSFFEQTKEPFDQPSGHPSLIPSSVPSSSESNRPSIGSNAEPTEMPTVIAAPSPRSISAGNKHTCAIDDNFLAWCWGSNDSGQLGIRRSLVGSSLIPVKVSVFEDNVILRVAAGGDHSCAIDSVSKLYCWGSNSEGQLGIGGGPTSKRDTPTEVLSLENAVSSIRLGDSHSCGVDILQTLWCWGSNSNGELGVDDTIEQRDVPTKVHFDGVSQLELGHSHTCAVDISSKLYCWGRNNHGQLGLGDTSNRWSPTQVTLVNDASVLALGKYHSCALDTSSKLFCWGFNIHGQLGFGDTISRTTPTEVLSSMIGIALGSWHSCAIDTNEDIWCWGWNNEGQLGVGEESSGSDTPTKVAAMNSASQISLGHYHSCAIENNGKVWCWGDNGNGQLGVGDESTRYIPTLSRFC